MKKCPIICLKCPFLCNLDRIFTKQELDIHLNNNECPNDSQECTGCGCEILNREI